MPAPALEGKAAAAAHIPLHAHSTVGEIHHLHMDPWLIRDKRGLGSEMGDPVLTLHSVVGLALIHPAAIHAEAHARRGSGWGHCEPWRAG